MKSHLNPILAAIVSALVVSCYPYPENPPPNRHQPNIKQQQQEAEAKAKATAAKNKEAAEKVKKEETVRKPQITERSGADQPKPTDPGPIAAPKTKKDWPVAKKIPGRDDQVLSPYNEKPVTIRYPDGRIIASGTVVGDPSFQGDKTKRFVVP